MEKKSRGRPKKVKQIDNSLGEAIFGNPFEMSNQIANTGTLFVGLRWYLISNMRQLLSELYAEIGTIQTIIDIPVDEGLKGGVRISSAMLEPEQITELENYLLEMDDFNTIGEAGKWARLYGGSGLIIVDGGDPSSPLKKDGFKDVSFKAVDLWELFSNIQYTGDMDTDISTPDQKLKKVEFYNYYGQRLHHSRVLTMQGKKAPSFIRPRLRGWGLSVLEPLVRSLNQYIKATDLTFEVLDEFKLDIYKIKGLTATLLNPQGAAKVRQRIDIANRQKNYQNAISMDAEDDYLQKQLSFSGISETMEGIRKQLASDLRMPMTKLFGISSAGFNSGEDDIENYNSMIESTIRNILRPLILKVIKIRANELFGFIPDDIGFEYHSLRMLSSEQEENVKNSKFNRALQARQAGEITDEQFKEICNREKLLGIDI